MKIERLALNGFGRLRDQSLTFSPTINVIAGPNEAGKSTLAEAMQAILFGLTDTAKETATASNKLRQQFKPWSGELFGGSLWVCLGNGEQYQIVRNFSDSRTKVYREPGATDVTNQYSPGKNGWISFADRHLGMTRSVFRACGWIDQAQLSYGKDQHATLKDKLEHLVGAPEEGVSAQAALAKLGQWHRQRINPDAHNVENSPYLKARDKVSRLRAELEQSRAALESLAGLVVQQRELAGKLQADEDELVRLDALLAARELAGIADKLSRLAEIEKDLTDVRLALGDLNDVAPLELRWFTDAENAIAALERGRKAVESAEKVVNGEGEEREAARLALDNIDRELVGLPDIAEEWLSAVDEVVRRWGTATERQSEAANALGEARRQLEARESVAERLGLEPGTTVESIRSAAQAVQLATRSLGEARTDLERARVSPAEEAEFDRLTEQIGDLTRVDLGEFEERERRLEFARQRSAANGSRAPLVIGLAILIGLGLGFTVLGGLGAAAGAVLGGVVGFLVTKVVANAGDAPDAARVAKNTTLLQEDLRRYGVESVDELCTAWDRRNELARTVGQARDFRARLEQRRSDLERAETTLAQIAGTRDVDVALKIDGELRQEQLHQQNLQSGLANAERAARKAADDLAEQRAEVSSQLASLEISVETPRVALDALARLRTARETRQGLLPQRAKLIGDIRLYSEHEAAMTRCRQDLTGFDGQLAKLATALEKVGLNLPVADPAAALERRRERFQEYLDFRTREQSLCSSRTILIGGEDAADWRRRVELLTESARTADPNDERSREELEACQVEIRRERDSLSGLLSGIRVQVNTTASQFREPAVIEEELAESERDYLELDRLKSALEDAQRTLSKVAEDFRRGFAPRLEARVGDPLTRITAGRYREVSIDPTTLAIRIRTFERTDLVELDGLSHGTRDAIALLLRASVAQLLSNNLESVPLFLDDPLVHVDSDRTRRVFDVLQDLSHEWQIFYFTQDQRVSDWARGNGAGVNLCELPAPSLPVGVS